VVEDYKKHRKKTQSSRNFSFLICACTVCEVNATVVAATGVVTFFLIIKKIEIKSITKAAKL